MLSGQPECVLPPMPFNPSDARKPERSHRAHLLFLSLYRASAPHRLCPKRAWFYRHVVAPPYPKQRLFNTRTIDITMYETLLRPYDVLQTPVPVPLNVIRERLQAAEQAKEDRRLQQIATSRARKEAPDHPTARPSKRKRDQIEDKVQESEKKRGPSESPRPTMIVSQPIKEVRGHTSYLTFACLLPSNVPELNQPQSEQEQPEPEGITAIPEPPQTDELDSDQDQNRPAHTSTL